MGARARVRNDGRIAPNGRLAPLYITSGKNHSWSIALARKPRLCAHMCALDLNVWMYFHVTKFRTASAVQNYFYNEKRRITVTSTCYAKTLILWASTLHTTQMYFNMVTWGRRSLWTYKWMSYTLISVHFNTCGHVVVFGSIKVPITSNLYLTIYIIFL